MTIRVYCPSGHRLSVPDDWAGRMIRCARCKKTALVPPPPEDAPPPQAESQRQSETRPPSTPAGEPSGGKPTTRPPPLPPKRSPGARLRSGPREATAPGGKPPPLPPQRPRVASRRASRRDRKRPGRGGVERAPSGAPEAAKRQRRRRQRRRPHRARQRRDRRQPQLAPPDVYQPDEGKIATVKWLALILGLAVLFSVTPVFVKMHLNLQAAPGWARAVLLMAALQAVYIAWMLNAPDWASVWVVMLVFAGVSAVYGTATAVALATPVDRPMWLGMEEVRFSAGTWCGAVLLVMSLATYLCGRTSAKWHRTFELETAGKRSARD